MEKSRIINMVMIVIAVALLAGLAFIVRFGSVADSVVLLRTTGMTCGSCIKKIERTLQSERGVASLEVNVDRGWVVVGFDSGEVGAERLASAVTSAGFGSTVAGLMTVDRFREMTGRNPGGTPDGKHGCGGCCETGGKRIMTKKERTDG